MTKKEHLQYVLERFNQNMDSLKVLIHDAHSTGEAKDVIMNIELVKSHLENVIDKYEYLTSDWNNDSFRSNENDDNWSDEADYRLLSYIRTGFDCITKYIESNAPYSFIKSSAYNIETLSHMITPKLRTTYPQIDWSKLDDLEIIVSGYGKEHYDELSELIVEIREPLESAYEGLDKIYGKSKKPKKKTKKSR